MTLTLRDRLAGRRAQTLEEAARAAGLGGTPADEEFLADLAAALAVRPDGRVAVLVQPGGDKLFGLLRAHHRGQVRRYDVTATDLALHVALAVGGRFDVIVDDTRSVRGRGDLLREAFFHLRPGGTLLVRDTQRGGSRGTEDDRLSAAIGAMMGRRLARQPKGRKGRKGRDDDRQLAKAVHTLTSRRQHLVLTSRFPVWAKLREEETNAWLKAQGEGAGRVLATRPATRLESRAVLAESDSRRAGGAPEAFDVPELSLREYRDVLCTPGQVVTAGNVMLPDSFRHLWRERMHNQWLEDFGPGFARPIQRTGSPPQLAGAYFYLDSEYRGHFGHALTEQLSRLWAWKQAKQQVPELKAVMARNKRRELARFEVDLYAAAGIDPDDLVFVREPVRVERLVAATPMFTQPRWVHPDLPQTWDAVSQALAAHAPERDYPSRFFCARRIGKRPCRNAAEVEAYFAAHGFAIVAPEEYPLAEQVRMFREADVVAGFAGSALFTLALAGSPKHAIVISSESYTARNEYMIAAAVGHRLDVAWCRPEIEVTPGRWTRKAFHSPFSVDFAREGVFLDRVLAGLPG